MFQALRFLRPRRQARSWRVHGQAGPRVDGSKLPGWTDVSLDDIPQVTGMTQPEELKYFYWCAATCHRLGNRVVELGPYVGRSTMALAAGLRRSADPDGKLVTIDHFQWEGWMFSYYLRTIIEGLSDSQRARLTPEQLNPKAGDSFFPIFEAQTEPLRDSIEAVNIDLDAYRWCGAPIDVLMIDAAKSWSALDKIVREFFPCLTEGAAVIHQDYKHSYTYWLHPVTERMLERGVLRMAENIHGTATQGYRFHKRGKFRVEDYLQSAFSSSELEPLMERSISRFPGEFDRAAVAAARCQMLKDQGQAGRAQTRFEEAISAGGFADNCMLGELIAVGSNWTRPLHACLLERATTRTKDTPVKASLRAVEARSVSIPASYHGEPLIVEVPALDVSGANALALNFRADTRAEEALRIRVEACDFNSTAPFYRAEFRILPGSYQPAVIPLAGRSKVTLQLQTDCEGARRISRELQCIAPMLFTNE
jgi:hypothetical protein